MQKDWNEKLKAEKEATEIKTLKLKKSENTIAIMRLITFLSGIFLIYIGIDGEKIFGLAGLILILLFIMLVRQTGKNQEEKNHLAAKEEVLRRYMFRMDDRWKKIEDDGSDFINADDTISTDLDLLGASSLYQLLNIAHTEGGRKKFAETITLRANHLENREKRLEASKELADNSELLIDFESASMSIGSIRKKIIEKQNEYETDDSGKMINSKVKTSISIFGMIIIPIMNVCSIALVAFGKIPVSSIFITFLFGLIMTTVINKIVVIDDIDLMAASESSDDYLKLLRYISGTEYKSEILSKMKNDIDGNAGMMKAINQMLRIQQLKNFSYNPILEMILDGFLGWDLYLSFASERWTRKHNNVFKDASELISKFEELGGLAVIRLIRNTTDPDLYFLNGSEPVIDASDIAHPLINIEKSIVNSVHLDNEITVITGSNMSGKTTFMRTLALNFILTYAGTGVTARYFKCPVMRIFTSMRVHDDVANGISTFYAEILRIKYMADYVAQEKNDDEMIPAICFIDEIFKGTNSADRIVGAEEAVKKIGTNNNMVLVTTHDFELCDLKTISNRPAANFHFEEHYENQNLMFDYKIKNGRCTTTNARAILRMAGLTEQ